MLPGRDTKLRWHRVLSTVVLQEYYLHALSGAKPHAEEGSSDAGAQRERASIWKSPLLSHASLPSATALRTVPAAM